MRALLAGLGGGALVLALAIAGTGYARRPLSSVALGPPGTSLDASASERPAPRAGEDARRRQLRAQLDHRRPHGVHVVIDQTHNRLYLKRGDELIRKAVCSAGSGMILREYGGQRKWVFDTPRGVFHIWRKVEDPIWNKPDWAFVEEGVPIPNNPAERFQRNMLGEYACYFGDGYLIHGTLYTRLLGRNVSHGCIRLGDDDLREVYHAVQLGTPVYIY
ncbi:MAG: L,D-transpeptidase [bacterium]